MAFRRLLVVEDEPALREGLEALLEASGYAVESCADGEQALRQGADPRIDCVLLDLMLPRIDGFAVCRRLRELRPALPIVMLTARGAEDDKVRGLRLGADDYVTKPFGARELVARIEALGRRLGQPAGEELATIEIDGLKIDLGRFQAEREGERISLTAREADILRWLFQHRSRAVSRAELLEVVWQAPGDLRTRTVDMTIANLRQKIERDPSEPRIVITVKGVGYAWGES